MEKDNKIFSLIVKNTIFAILKEKYPDYHIDDTKDNENIIQITNLLRNLEKYSHIPDKQEIVKKEFYEIKSFIKEDIFREQDFLNRLKIDTENLTLEEKEYILNSVIFTVNEDKKISDVEKEIILQISRFLEIQSDYKTILKHYNKSELKESSISVMSIVLIGLSFLLLTGGGLFWKYQQTQNREVKVFNNKRLVFNELYFNKFIIYQNKFNIENEHFKKQVVFYLNGKAEISFKPQNLSFNPVSKMVTYTYSQYEMFQTEISDNKFLEVDRIKPKPISEEEAKKLAVGVGITGAVLGAKVGNAGGSLLSKVIPPPYGKLATMAGTGAGGIFGGVGSYYLSFNALNGLKLSKDITEKEMIKVKEAGVELIRSQILLNEELQDLYKKNFEDYIKLQYSQHGKEVKNIEYKVVK